MKIGEFNLGIQKGDTVTIYFDERFNAFYFQGRLPNSLVWLKAMRLFTATGKEGVNSQLQYAPTFADDFQRKYGVEIHVHAYYVNRLLPKILELKHDFGEGIKRAEEYQETIEDLERQAERAKTDAINTQNAPHLGKVYSSRYQEAKADYDSLVREYQEVLNNYKREMQELNRLATQANAVVFTISISSDVRIVPDGSAVAIALNECLNELVMRSKNLYDNAALQLFHLEEVRQPYFFFLTELSGMFNPSMLVANAHHSSFLEIFKAMFPNLNVASTMKTELNNMRHLSSYTPSEILRKMLLQMEIATPTRPEPVMQQQEIQQGAVQQNQPPPRGDYLTEGELIGRDLYGRDVRLNFRSLDNHVLIEGMTGKGKSSFARLLTSIAIEKYNMRVIAMDISPHWSVLVRKYNGRIFDKVLDVEEAFKHPFSLCVSEKGNIEGIETNFLKPFYDYIKKTRGMQARKDKDIMLIVDESHNFGKKLKRGILVDIIAELGKYGLIVMLISQRSQYVGIDARSQAGLRFNTQINIDYHKPYSLTYGGEIADAMLRVKKYNFYVHGVDISPYFEMTPLRLNEEPEPTPEECKLYRYTDFDTEPSQVLINTNESKISSSEPTPKDELTEEERKGIKALQENGGSFDSLSAWWRAITGEKKKSGEHVYKLMRSLRNRGYVLYDDSGSTGVSKKIELTEKGRSL